ncbi:predicted protein [Nematostella vectensis]|uniref:Uncharacterized protein n=1 Tax=Nematostella vectensis TaxID=45351 RepID=A7SPA9_NEMVE|nr:predicted protein [Nematostella vectensis]|eukprot:XP_001626572.1 predicted protein [Nematostella vectensis]
MASCDPVKMEKSYKRQKHRCPVPACQKEVIHLPRHLITVHKWSREKALEALSVFDLRAKRTKSEAVPEQRAKRTYKRRVCSFPGCNLIVRRLHNHLNAKHKLSRHDERYKQLLKESRWEEIGEDFQEECVVEISSDTESEPEQEPDPQSQSQSKGKGQSQSKSSQSSTMSSNEEEMCLQEIHRKSEKAKAIMRGGQVDQHKYSSSDDDSDEVIPSSPIGKKRSIFLKRALADIHTNTPKVHAIIKDVDPDELRIDSILNKKHLRDKWLQKLERNRKPGTCKAYLGSLSRFLRFLVVEKLEDLKLTEEHVTKVRVQVQEWSASFKKPFKERRWEKHQEDLEKLITPEDVQKFSKSAPYMTWDMARHNKSKDLNVMERLTVIADQMGKTWSTLTSRISHKYQIIGAQEPENVVFNCTRSREFMVFPPDGSEDAGVPMDLDLSCLVRPRRNAICEVNEVEDEELRQFRHTILVDIYLKEGLSSL